MKHLRQRLFNFIETNEALIILLLISVILRLPSLHEPFWYGDEGVYLVLGQALKKGLVWYRDIHDNKPPMLYLLAALSGNVMWFRLLTMLANLVNIAIIWKLAQRFFTAHHWVILATSLFVLATCLPTLEGNIANAEIFMILPITAAMLLLLNAKSLRTYFLSGVLFSLGFLFKVPSAFDFIAAGLWLLFFGGLQLRQKAWFNKLFWLALGFLLPLAVTFIYYFALGAGRQYFNAAFLQNIGYLASWRTGTQTRSGISSQSGLLWRGMILLTVTATTWWLTRKDDASRRLLPLWFAFALFGALLSERPYPHYLIQILPPAVILLPQLLVRQKKNYLVLLLLLAGLTIGSVLRYRFYFYPTVKYYQTFIQYITGQISPAEYRNSFDRRVDRNYQIASYIRLHSRPDDHIFVWGDEPFIYALSNRLPTGRYTVAYHIIDFNGQEETMRAIEQAPPLYIVLETNEKRNFKKLIAFTLANYVPVVQIDDATIFRHL
ncbi:MAG: Glycosyl transferase family protein [Candidatus Gottesmanbacteria bacterium GW2011_GWA1_47_8]|uniref:Glycosyl transferase family protein n=1 Tax=Candidatus Gottesmanbacteria bacterium GW2011_GWA1_47_8 TaxID=1618438 RepID=A0A0G1TG60_9BACT|nr:MAG: Glycosyl transferase family protein [Candidatus Gottesmanbacteria bacterium GW2011_GWA1_47_8]